MAYAKTDLDVRRSRLSSLTIAHVTIQQDENGRYSLNDLYKASGSENRHRPSLWMRSAQTKALIDELVSEHENVLRKNPSEHKNAPAPVAVEATGNPSTFVVKELVYAYAMWISPAFNLKVIRAYDALVTGQIKDEKQARIKFEHWYFNRYEKDRMIRQMALKGEPYFYIAHIVQRTAGTVGKAIKRMLACGIINADSLRSARIGMQSWWLHRRKHMNQIPLF